MPSFWAYLNSLQRRGYIRRLYASSTEFRSILINSGFKNCFGLHLRKNRKTKSKNALNTYTKTQIKRRLYSQEGRRETLRYIMLK